MLILILMSSKYISHITTYSKAKKMNPVSGEKYS
ncbi:hypothetical protein Echvi_2574 [Echinicola vietnamensis DSM 17526]|uniref:Uncharacterized protein n=1 Tax=Echinicola vietnamensis (strain DSM 17526 / LMG 23754 / KMM 6221) TaxID=926556 RepID=L0G1C6_ECHVK|nr:hypothetical protein Echvi_2574 [Echinicola vietnamensis DSM 17526]